MRWFFQCFSRKNKYTNTVFYDIELLLRQAGPKIPKRVYPIVISSLLYLSCLKFIVFSRQIARHGSNKEQNKNLSLKWNIEKVKLLWNLIMNYTETYMSLLCSSAIHKVVLVVWIFFIFCVMYTLNLNTASNRGLSKHGKKYLALLGDSLVVKRYLQKKIDLSLFLKDNFHPGNLSCDVGVYFKFTRNEQVHSHSDQQFVHHSKFFPYETARLYCISEVKTRY